MEARGQPGRPTARGAWVTELTGTVNLGSWPEGTRLICRRERPHPGAQLSFTDTEGHRFQCFITDQEDQDIAALEATHRQHAEIEDRVKTLKATGAGHLPFHDFQANVAWFELALLAHDIMAFTQQLLLDGQHAIAEPKRLRYQLREIDPGLRVPKHWFVAEEPGHNACAYAATMCVDRGLLESPYAAAVIAHELGHLNTSDARLTSALNLLLITPMPTPTPLPLWSLPFRGLAWLATGQAVLWLTGNAWDAYWRNREYTADQFAARLGQGPALATSLEHGSLPYARSIRGMRFSRATHPYTKPRITKLRANPTDHTNPGEAPS